MIFDDYDGLWFQVKFSQLIALRNVYETYSKQRQVFYEQNTNKYAAQYAQKYLMNKGFHFVPFQNSRQ